MINKLHNPLFMTVNSTNELGETHSHDRYRYWKESDSTSSEEILEKTGRVLAEFHEREETRLDLRFLLAEAQRGERLTLFTELQKAFQNLEIGTFRGSIEGNQHVHIYSNKIPRSLPHETLKKLQQGVAENVKRATGAIGNFEDFALEQLEATRTQGHILCQDGFTAEELHNLWGEAHGTSLESCRSFLSKDSNVHVFGRRNSEGDLLALSLIDASDGAIAETTEWAVPIEQRARGLITPVLIAAHAFASTLNSPTYAHLRVGRSTSPAIRSGMTVDSALDGDPRDIWLVSNHTEIALQEPADNWKAPGDESRLRTYVLGSVNKAVFSRKIVDAYRAALS